MSDLTNALRLGWAVAEARGRSWPDAPKPPPGTGLPPVPLGVLPLRSQRESGSSREEAARTMVSRARALGLPSADLLDEQVEPALAGADWGSLSEDFLRWDGRLQDDLAERDEALANAYLLARGLAECYWGLGPEREWGPAAEPTGVAPGFLFGDERRRELTRMLGRLPAEHVHELTPSVISGTLEAWAEVATEPAWTLDRPDYLRTRLYEQVRRWYQLLVLAQDPTTMVRPAEHLANRYYLSKTLRAFWLPAVLALVALTLTSTFVTTLRADVLEWAKPLLATGGLSALALAGLLTKGQSAAQRMVTRLRQDAYTDLVAVSVTAVPDWPDLGWELDRADGKEAWQRARRQVERAVRRRRLTPPTAAPST